MTHRVVAWFIGQYGAWGRVTVWGNVVHAWGNTCAILKLKYGYRGHIVHAVVWLIVYHGLCGDMVHGVTWVIEHYCSWVVMHATWSNIFDEVRLFMG